MTVDLWSVDRARELTAFYNEQIHSLPHSASVQPGEFEMGIRWSQAPQLIDHAVEQFVVAQDEGRIIGFAHLGVCKPWQADGEARGLIRFLTCEPGQRSAGRQILAVAEQTLARMGFRRVIAFDIHHGYQFYHVGRGFLVDRLTHVLGLMVTNGYDFDETQVFLELDPLQAYDPPMPKKPAQADLVIASTPGDPPGLRIRLMRGQDELGRCVSRPLSHHHRSLATRDQFMVGGLHVAEELRGRGWGRYLLLRMHWEMQERGYHRALIGTGPNNGLALLLYGNEGYQIICNEYTFTKTL